jgi:hypothetical protein
VRRRLTGERPPSPGATGTHRRGEFAAIRRDRPDGSESSPASEAGVPSCVTRIPQRRGSCGNRCKACDDRFWHQIPTPLVGDSNRWIAHLCSCRRTNGNTSGGLRYRDPRRRCARERVWSRSRPQVGRPRILDELPEDLFGPSGILRTISAGPIPRGEMRGQPRLALLFVRGRHGVHDQCQRNRAQRRCRRRHAPALGAARRAGHDRCQIWLRCRSAGSQRKK